MKGPVAATPFLLRLHAWAQEWGGPTSCQVEGHRINYYWAQPSFYGGFCTAVKDALKIEKSPWRPVSLSQAGTDSEGAATLQGNTSSLSRAAPPPTPVLRPGCPEHPLVYDNEHCLHVAKCPRGQNVWSAASDLKALSQQVTFKGTRPRDTRWVKQSQPPWLARGGTGGRWSVDSLSSVNTNEATDGF